MAAAIVKRHRPAPGRDLMETCPLPAHEFRNGNLNQLAYSLFLFIRDVAAGDLVDWIDRRLAEAQHGPRKVVLAECPGRSLSPSPACTALLTRS